MRAHSLWYALESHKGAQAVVTLQRCLNCGEVKVLSNPCGFDHMAALMEFGEVAQMRAVADRQNAETLAAADLLAPQRPLERDLSDFRLDQAHGDTPTPERPAERATGGPR